MGSGWPVCSWLFFFQAEDGIRDVAVTGVQTCALPIFGQGSHGFFLEQARHHLGRNHIAAVLEQLDRRATGIRGTEGDRILAETAGNDDRNGRRSPLEGRFRGGRAVFGLRRSLYRGGASLVDQGPFFLETPNQALRGAAGILVPDENLDLRRRVAAPSENDRENAE